MADTPQIKARLRSIDDLDGRTVAARHARGLVGALTRDIGGDPSAAQGELIQRAALLGAFLGDCEARWLAGGDVDVAAWLSATDRQRRLLEALGLDRRPRAVEVSPLEYAKLNLESYTARKGRT